MQLEGSAPLYPDLSPSTRLIPVKTEKKNSNSPGPSPTMFGTAGEDPEELELTDWAAGDVTQRYLASPLAKEKPFAFSVSCLRQYFIQGLLVGLVVLCVIAISYKIIDVAVNDPNDQEPPFEQFGIRSDPTARCNDGSAPVFYIRRPAKESRRWVIRVPGGHGCFNEGTCNARFAEDSSRMSTADLPTSVLWSTIETGGLFSYDKKVNAYWNANLVHIHYCSSDFWTGDSGTSRFGHCVIWFDLIIFNCASFLRKTLA